MKIECYEGSSGQWSWHLKSGNNQVVCRSDDSYNDGPSVKKAAQAFAKKLADPVDIEMVPINPAPVEG